MMRRVVLRADGNSEIGLGHLFRMIALAQALKNTFELYFITKKPNDTVIPLIEKEVDNLYVISETEDELALLKKLYTAESICVLDGYDFGSDFQGKIRQLGYCLVYVDDYARGKYVADVVINHSPGFSKSHYTVEKHTKLYLGPEYLFVRKEFAKLEVQQREFEITNKLLLTMGGSDPVNLTSIWIEGVIDTFNEVKIILGSGYIYNKELEQTLQNVDDSKFEVYRNVSADDMVGYMVESDVIICPSSTIAHEACKVGMALFTGYYVDNQKQLANNFDSNGLGVSYGDLNLFEKTKFELILEKLRRYNKVFSENQRKQYGFRSDQRFVELFTSLKRA